MKPFDLEKALARGRASSTGLLICLHTEYRERPATSKRNHQSTRPRPA
ncbi:hypothetical protein [Avibacterium paragallinarum]|nr:hypothetical protein [Avibacterium paragallinarum]